MSGQIKSYQDLKAWQLSMKFTKTIYRVTDDFPDTERFGLISQLRRASVSVPSNIAEGWGRFSTNDYARFLRMARGSLFEVETQLILAKDLGFLREDQFDIAYAEVNEAGRVLTGLVKSIEEKLKR